MYQRNARYYDALYSWKDYSAESTKLVELVQAQAQRPAGTLLDVACGTGAHLVYLRDYFHIEGVDFEPEMLSIARDRLPGVALTQGDMVDFDLGRSFDVVTCLFGSIGYVKTLERLNQALANMARHVSPGGLLVIEPWFMPERFQPGTIHSLFVDQPDLRIARMNVSTIEGRLSILHFHYMVGTPQGIDYWDERHEMALFTHEEYTQAFHSAGLDVSYDEQGLWGRGLYTGLKSEAAC
ncbi:MAG TPA: class I SAM-dependent methyltransferase [Chloroflexia bacterium]|nr:class I SAM-dependent methyltransferase [Chloroflexia bacterium]